MTFFILYDVLRPLFPSVLTCLHVLCARVSCLVQLLVRAQCSTKVHHMALEIFWAKPKEFFYKSVPASVISTVSKYGMPALSLGPGDLDTSWSSPLVALS